MAWGRDESRQTCLPRILNLCFKLYLQFKDVYLWAEDGSLYPKDVHLERKDTAYFLYEQAFLLRSERLIRGV